MMLKNLLKKPTLNYDSVLYVVQFGSSTEIGKIPNDIDIAVIYKNIPLKEQLTTSQEIKELLQKQSSIPIHMTSYTMESLFAEGNFAKNSILRGIDLNTKDFFSKQLGFVPKVHMFYSLKKLEKKDKVRFNYFLNGKKDFEGYLKSDVGELIKPGFISLNPLYEFDFFECLKEDIALDVIFVLEQINTA